MARIRTVKPEFWTDERLTECSLSARLLFIGMLNFADDNGNLAYSAKRLKMQVFPADSIDTQPLLDELLTHGMLMEYSVKGEKFLHIKGFLKHQVINRPSATAIPTPDFNDDSVTTHGVLTDGREGKGKERKGKEGKEEGEGEGNAAQAPKPTSAKQKSRKTAIPENFAVSERVAKWAAKGGFTQLPEHFDAFTRKCAAKGYEYVDWDAAFMEAIREDWAKLRGRTATGIAPPANHASADELETKASVEKLAFSKGLDAWDSLIEPWSAYKAKVLRAPHAPSFDLAKLGSMAAARGLQ